MKYLKKFNLFESNYDDFEHIPSYVNASGNMVGMVSDNQRMAGKLAYEELEEMGVPVAEQRWHDRSPLVLFMIDAEEDSEGVWVNPLYGSTRAKDENWFYPTISNRVQGILNKYSLLGQWSDGATLNISNI